MLRFWPPHRKPLYLHQQAGKRDIITNSGNSTGERPEVVIRRDKRKTKKQAVRSYKAEKEVEMLEIG